jgi:hypothetical protein
VPITVAMNAWANTWSTTAARNGETRSVSRWLGLNVDRSSDPVLGTSSNHRRMETRDALLETRARHAFALLLRQADYATEREKPRS